MIVNASSSWPRRAAGSTARSWRAATPLASAVARSRQASATRRRAASSSARYAVPDGGSATGRSADSSPQPASAMTTAHTTITTTVTRIGPLPRCYSRRAAIEPRNEPPGPADRVVMAPHDDRDRPARPTARRDDAPAAIAVEAYAGSRRALRALFELAEDSAEALDAYIDARRVLVAPDGERVVGHLQITATGGPAEAEVKNTAVAPSHQGRGIGRALMAAAIALARPEGRSTLVVATAAADTGNLRFYQRLGFRMRSIERDAFSESSGYAPGTEVDGIPLRDRVWLDLPIAVPPESARRRR